MTLPVLFDQLQGGQAGDPRWVGRISGSPTRSQSFGSPGPHVRPIDATAMFNPFTLGGQSPACSTPWLPVALRWRPLHLNAAEQALSPALGWWSSFTRTKANERGADRRAEVVARGATRRNARAGGDAGPAVSRSVYADGVITIAVCPPFRHDGSVNGPARPARRRHRVDTVSATRGPTTSPYVEHDRNARLEHAGRCNARVRTLRAVVLRVKTGMKGVACDTPSVFVPGSFMVSAVPAQRIGGMKPVQVRVRRGIDARTNFAIDTGIRGTALNGRRPRAGLAAAWRCSSAR